jgi:hypothetical protein
MFLHAKEKANQREHESEQFGGFVGSLCSAGVDDVLQDKSVTPIV